MGDELAHFSVLDDESSTSYFLNWAGGFGGCSKLRGGDKVVDKTSSDFEDASAGHPVGVASQAVPLTDHEISKAGSKTLSLRYHIERSIPLPPPIPNVALPQAEALPESFPITPRAIQDAQPAELGTPGNSPVISVAHRRSAYTNKFPSPKAPTVNRLDEEPAAKKPTTPTQQRLLERLGPVEQKAPSMRPVSLSTQSEAETSGVKHTECANGTRLEDADPVSIMPAEECARSRHQQNTTGVSDAMESQYFSPQASTEFSPAADGFRYRTEDNVKDSTSNDTLPTSGADLPCDDATADVKPEGRMDLTPVLKALGARSTAQPTIKTITSEVSTIDVEHARATPTKATSNDVLPATIDESAAEGNAIPVAFAEQPDDKITSNLTATPTKAVDVLEKAQAESRTVVLKNLPDDADHTMVQSLIYGAVIESMKLFSEKNTANVKVTDVEDCRRYVDSCPVGIKVKGNRVQQTVLVENSAEPDTIDDTLQAYLDCGATRVVKVEHADEEMAIKALYKFAEGPSGAREVESIVDSCRKGIRSIVFRFTGIYDAVAFRSALLRDRNWKSKDAHFAEDPCEHANSPRNE